MEESSQPGYLMTREISGSACRWKSGKWFKIFSLWLSRKKKIQAHKL